MASHARGDRLPSDGTDDEQRAGQAASLSKDAAFHLLQNGRRRAVLRYLLATEATAPVDVRDVAAAVAAWEARTTLQQVDADDRHRMYVSLYQSHLPQLDEHGVIDYDTSRRTVALQRSVAALTPFLDDGLHAPQTVRVDTAASEEPSTALVDDVLSRLGLPSR